MEKMLYSKRRTLLNASLIAIVVVLQGCAKPPTNGSPASMNPESPQIERLLEAHPCLPADDGTREGYHYPGDDIWLPECENPLAREYWRVFLQSEKSAYIIPRPDGAPELQPVCADEGHPLRGLIDHYLLCSAATSASQLDKVNNMLPEDALQLAHYLHVQLRFRIKDDGAGITPFPMPADIIAACDLHPQINSVDLGELCDRERSRLESGHDIGYIYSGDAAIELVELLNELYGVH